jgi:hypothetical protein
MKSAKELVEIVANPEELKRRALALRRLAGSVRAEADRTYTGLSTKDIHLLQNAASLLEKIAANHKAATTLAQANATAKLKAERALHLAIQANFCKLVSIPDQIALIAAVNPGQLKNQGIQSAADLRAAFEEAITSLVWRLTEKALQQKPAQVVAEAWARFSDTRADLVKQHTPLIERLQEN